MKEPEKAYYGGENSSIINKPPASKQMISGSRRILGSRRMTSSGMANSPSRNFMNGPGNNIERRDDMIAVHD